MHAFLKNFAPHKSLTVAVLLGAMLLLPVLPSAAQDQARPDFNGSWRFNPRKSDDIAAVMREKMGDRPGAPGMRGGGMKGGGRRGGMRGSGMSTGNQAPAQSELPAKGQRPGSEDLAKRARMVRQEYAHLDIFLEGDEFDVTNGLDITQSFHTDGKPVTVWTPQGESQATAIWLGRDLVIQWLPGERTTGRTRTFHLSDHGKTLTVTELRMLPGQDEMVELHLVYDRQQ